MPQEYVFPDHLQNWKAEFQKWLGKDRVGVTACANDKTNIDAFFYK